MLLLEAQNMIVEIALHLSDLDIQYAEGGDTLDGMDCSGMWVYIMQQMGYKGIWGGHQSHIQFISAPKVILPQPGDAVFFVGAPSDLFRPGHVGCNIKEIGATTYEMVNAPFTGEDVRVDDYDTEAVGDMLVMGYNRPALVLPGIVTPVVLPELFLTTPMMHGTYVTQCQNDLVKHGFKKALGPTGADGWFGTYTKEAVESFQRSEEIGVDGIVGKLTWEHLQQA